MNGAGVGVAQASSAKRRGHSVATAPSVPPRLPGGTPQPTAPHGFSIGRSQSAAFGSRARPADAGDVAQQVAAAAAIAFVTTAPLRLQHQFSRVADDSLSSTRSLAAGISTGTKEADLAAAAAPSARLGPAELALASPLWATQAGSREIVVAEDFETVYGEVLPEVRVTVEEWGDTTLGPDRTIAIFPSFSHGHHVAANASDPSPGWWDGMVGPGRWLDTNRFRIVCSSVLGSPMGSTSPRSVDPRTGRPYRMRFPTITTADQARAHALALDALGLDRVHAAVGASLGGMQVLQFATLFPERVGRVAALVSTGQTSPGSVALRRIQRQAIMADPDWRGGDYEDAAGPASRGPLTGLRLAREVGMLVYRSRQEFDSRFDWRATGEPGPADTTFEVESYLAYQGAKFARGGAMDANSYLKLSKCMDLHNIANPRLRPGNTFEDAAADIRADALLIGVEQDMLTPAQELRALAQAMTAGGGRAEFRSISSEFGHDAFLKEFDTLGPMLRDHVEKGIRQQLDLEEVHTTGLSHP